MYRTNYQERPLSTKHSETDNPHQSLKPGRNDTADMHIAGLPSPSTHMCSQTDDDLPVDERPFTWEPTPNNPPETQPSHVNHTPSAPPTIRLHSRITNNNRRRKNQRPKNCTCPLKLRLLMKNLDTAATNLVGIQFFVRGMNMGIKDMCHMDLRKFVKKSIGLLNNVTADTMISRARSVFLNRNHLNRFRNIHSSWFERSARDIAPAELLEPFRFNPVPEKKFTFNHLAVLERLAGPHAYETWLRDGSLIVPNLLQYITTDPELFQMIGKEFNMYEHHFQPHTSKPNMGFLRNMFYSLTQQMVRQDPAWYALNVACRPSHDWRLITYPYVAKMVNPGDKTGFAHTDINLAKWVNNKHGANQLTSSLSLDHETPTNCTVIVPGFHRHATEWHHRLIQRQREPTGTTTNAQKLYLPEDENTFGHFVPQVCGPGDVRVTLPEVIHGSTPEATIQRRVIFPWFTAIMDDLETLEIAGQLSWSEVAACHRDMKAPSRGVSGDTVSFSCPISRFKASVHMPSSSALSDALIGRRSYEDPEVLMERDILLGDDPEAAQHYISHTRTQLVANFKSSYAKMVAIEQRAFGINSFFRSK